MLIINEINDIIIYAMTTPVVIITYKNYDKYECVTKRVKIAQSNRNGCYTLTRAQFCSLTNSE